MALSLLAVSVFVVKDNNKSLDESASNAFQAFHADVFPFPWKDDVVSQPVMAWNSGSAFAFLGPNASQMMSVDIYTGNGSPCQRRSTLSHQAGLSTGYCIP